HFAREPRPQQRRTTMIQTLVGTVKTWKLFEHTRQFAEVTLPYTEANELFMPVRYNGLTGMGEQRVILPAHLRKLKKAMEAGQYTPTPASAGLRNKHREAVRYEKHSDGTVTFRLEVDSNDPLPLTDGGHRMEAIRRIIKETEEKLALAKDDCEKAKLQAQRDEARNLPVTVTIYLDGEPQRDFINLQAGRN